MTSRSLSLVIVVMVAGLLVGCRQRQEAPSVYNPSLSPEAQKALAELPADADKYDRMLAIANTLEDKEERADRVGNVAALLVQEGQVDRGLELARTIKEDVQRAEALSAILQSLAMGGDKEKVAEVTKELESLRAAIRRTKSVPGGEEAAPPAPEATPTAPGKEGKQ